MATISRTGISNTSTIDAEHITRIIDALDGAEATEIIASGSFSGSFTGSYDGDFSGSFSGDGTNITGVTAEWDGTHNGNAQITGSLVVTSTISASNFTGVTSGTNTGDQDLSSYAQTANVVANSATASFVFNSVTSSMSVATASFGVTSSYVAGGNVDGAVANATAATNATNATNVAITAESSNNEFYVHFGSATSGNDGVNVTATGSGLEFNPSTGTLSTNILSATLISNVSTTHVTASANIIAGGFVSASGTTSALTYIEKTTLVTAAGNNQDSAEAITVAMGGRIFVLGADNTKGVSLPLTSEVAAGTTITIHNTVSNKTLEVYPAVGDQILPVLAQNNAATVPAGAVIVATKYATSRWMAYFGGIIS